jgi:hypothetical protein
MWTTLKAGLLQTCRFKAAWHAELFARATKAPFVSEHTLFNQISQQRNVGPAVPSIGMRKHFLSERRLCQVFRFTQCARGNTRFNAM